MGEKETNEEKLNRILGYLEDDHATNTPGLVSQVRNLQEDVSNIKTSEKVLRGKASAYAVFATILLNGLYWLIKFIIPKIFV